MEENAIPAPAPAKAKPCTLCTSNNTEKRKEKAEQPQKNSDMTTSYTEKTARKGGCSKSRFTFMDSPSAKTAAVGFNTLRL